MKEVNRAILKLSGELFEDGNEHISFEQYDTVSKQLIDIYKKTKIQLALVVGGGNIFRGRQANQEVDHVEADSIGMLATIMNGIALREALVRNGAKSTRLMSAINIPNFAEPYIIPRARNHLSKKRLIIIAGGLGRPGFSTDSAVTFCAAELNCKIVFKASTVDGVYDSDPKTNPEAKKYGTLTYRQALEQRLKVMDQTAFTKSEESRIPIFVFDIKDLDRLPEAIAGDYSFGTLVSQDGSIPEPTKVPTKAPARKVRPILVPA